MSKPLRDVLGPDLKVLFCGINPSLMSYERGHHFARPGNRFWPALHGAGWTPRLMTPDEDAELPALGIGITNVVDRPTRAASELTDDELREGARALTKLVERIRPGVVAGKLRFKRCRALRRLELSTCGRRAGARCQRPSNSDREPLRPGRARHPGLFYYVGVLQLQVRRLAVGPQHSARQPGLVAEHSQRSAGDLQLHSKCHGA